MLQQNLQIGCEANMARTYRLLTYEDRLQIKEMLDNGYRPLHIANALGFHNTAIYREIALGSINGQYNPSFAQQQHEVRSANKGAPSLLSVNSELALYISKAILEEHLSPERIVEKLRKESRFSRFPKSVNTIYSAIDRGMIPGVTRDTLKSYCTTVFNNGHVCLPKWLRESMHISDGDNLYIQVDKETITLTKKV